MWKNIKRKWGDFSRFVRFEVGSGAKIKFWHNEWCEDLILKTSLPEMFSISRFKEVSMADHLQFSSNIIQWNINFIRPVYDWEVELITLFFNLLYSI